MKWSSNSGSISKDVCLKRKKNMTYFRRKIYGKRVQRISDDRPIIFIFLLHPRGFSVFFRRQMFSNVFILVNCLRNDWLFRRFSKTILLWYFSLHGNCTITLQRKRSRCFLLVEFSGRLCTDTGSSFLTAVDCTN